MNTWQQIPVPYGSMLYVPPTNLLLVTAKQEPYRKAHFLTKFTEEFSGKKSQQKGPAGRGKIRQKQ